MAEPKRQALARTVGPENDRARPGLDREIQTVDEPDAPRLVYDIFEHEGQNGEIGAHGHRC